MEDRIPQPARDALMAVLEALDIPNAATVGDQEMRDHILVERVGHAVVMLRGILREDAADDIGWAVAYLRDRLAEHPSPDTRRGASAWRSWTPRRPAREVPSERRPAGRARPGTGTHLRGLRRRSHQPGRRAVPAVQGHRYRPGPARLYRDRGGVVTAPDQRVILAREYLADIRRQHVDQLPPSVLVRECAELRRRLGQLLDVIDSQTPAVVAGNVNLTPEQVATVLAALEDAAGWREYRATSACLACAESPTDLCEEHALDLDRVGAYRELIQLLGGEQ